jgi:hypothetical protein
MCIDCARSNGCSGGFPDECLDHQLRSGYNFEPAYPYANRVGICAPKTGFNAIDRYYARPWYNISPDETLMAYIVYSKGWVAASINALPMQFYSGGIVRAANCALGPNHSIIIVGYGTENGVKYWLCRNSWSAAWGDKGYFKLERGANACDIAHRYERYRAFLD